MKQVAGQLKLLYSQYRELQAFAQFGSDLDKDTRDRLDLGARIVEVLKQGRNAPLDVALQVVIIYAVTKGYLDKVPVERVREFESELFIFMEGAYDEVLESIRESGQLSEVAERRLKEALELKLQDFLGTEK